MASRALLLFGGVAAGYMWRDHQLVSNVREYQGVRVVSEINPQKYDMLIPGLPRTYKVDFCHVLKMPPTDCIDIKWEQRFGCKVVNGVGYIRPSKETCPNVQTGRDSSPAAASTAARLETRR